MTPTEILIAAREKIERGWTQKEYARTDGGEGVKYNSPDAVCWCSIGAICAVDDSRAGDSTVRIFADTIEIRTADIPHWNDAPDRTQDDVLIAFGWAIQASMDRRR